MDSPSGKNSERIRVGGIKISSELVQFVYTCPSHTEFKIQSALEKLASRNINITYLTFATSGNVITSSFCVTSDNITTVQGIIHSNTDSSDIIQIFPSVGSLTLFPHRNSIAMCGKVLKLFGKHNLVVYGVCTSISTLTLITDFSRLNDAITALEEIVELPENHSPFQQEFQIRQIGQ